MTFETIIMMTSLDEEIKKAMVKLPFFIRGKDQIAFARHFAEWGAEHAREQMMKEAVECETVCFKDRLLAVLPMKEFQWTVGDKVRIIVLKKED